MDLPQGSRTPDAVIKQLSVSEARVVVTKDRDFVDSLIVDGVPHKLLLEHLETIVAGFSDYDFIEIDCTALRFHY